MLVGFKISWHFQCQIRLGRMFTVSWHPILIVTGGVESTPMTKTHVPSEGTYMLRGAGNGR